MVLEQLIQRISNHITSEHSLPSPEKNLLLLAKTLILSLIFCDFRFFSYGEIYTSIIPGIESFSIEITKSIPVLEQVELSSIIWKILFFFFTIKVFTNRWIKPSLCFLGLLLIYGLSANPLLYNNNVFYIAGLFIVIGLSPQQFTWRFIYIQASIVYIMTVFTKGDGWYDGSFMAACLQDGLFFRNHIHETFIVELVPKWILIALSIITLIAEFLIGFLILFKNVRIYSALIAVMFHSFLAVLFANTFSVFLTTIYLVNWLIIIRNQKLTITYSPKANALTKISTLLIGSIPDSNKTVMVDKDSSLTIIDSFGIKYQGIRALIVLLRNSSLFIILMPLLFLALLNAPFITLIRAQVIAGLFFIIIFPFQTIPNLLKSTKKSLSST